MTRPMMCFPGWRCAALLMLGAALAPVGPAESAESSGSARYTLDPVHTRVMFAISHAGYSQAIGTVPGSSGTLEFDPGDLRSARLEASVPIARLELGDAKWNQAALASNLLDGKDHPVATFVSTRVEPIDAQHASVFGTLTLHGVAKEVKLDVTVNKVKRYPLPPFRRTAGFSATTTISRKDFGIGAWPTLIGDSVELRIEAEAQRARGDAPGQEDAATQEQPATDAITPAPVPEPAPTPAPQDAHP